MASFGGLQISASKSVCIFDNGVAAGTLDYTVPAGMQLVITSLTTSQQLTSNTSGQFFAVYSANSSGTPVYYGCTAVTNAPNATTILPTNLILGPGDRIKLQAKNSGHWIQLIAVLQSNS